MSSARRDFTRSFRSLRHAAMDASLQDKAARQRKHNAKAGILRNGLAVVGFATLEHFFRERTSELIATLNGAGAKFSQLTAGQRHSLTVGTLNAIGFQSRLAGKRGEDVAEFIVDELECFAKYRDAAPSYSRLHIGQGKSNLLLFEKLM